MRRPCARQHTPRLRWTPAAAKIALLGTGYGQAHAAVYDQRPDVEQVVLFGRIPETLAS